MAKDPLFHIREHLESAIKNVKDQEKKRHLRKAINNIGGILGRKEKSHGPDVDR